MVNRFFEACAKSQMLGHWVGLGWPLTAPKAAHFYDVLLFDLEHSGVSFDDVTPLCNAVVAANPNSPPPVIVRVPNNNNPGELKWALDRGADGVMVPMIETPEQARWAVNGCRYCSKQYPQGFRGVAAAQRGSNFGARNAYFKHANDFPVFLQIETKAGLEALPPILQEVRDKNVVLFFGPADYAATVDYLGEPGHGVVQEAFKRFLRQCQAASVYTSTLSTDTALAQNALNLECNVVFCSTDLSVISFGTKAAVSALHTHNIFQSKG